MKEKFSVIILSGLAGSGKSAAIQALEDCGYYCIDNLPSGMLPAFLTMLESGQAAQRHLALALDSRDILIPERLPEFLEQLRKIAKVQVVFLEAREAVVMRRFRETRRMHPLSMDDGRIVNERALPDAIALDAEILHPVRAQADVVLDTSEMLTTQLKQWISRNYSADWNEKSLLLTLSSFGFKHGTPSDFEMIFDVRCFPNPFYVDELRVLTGLHEKVRKYVLSEKNVQEFIEKVQSLINFLYPLYVQEGKRYLAIGIGCTGGQHRSVAIVEELALRLKKEIGFVLTEHRHAKDY